MNVYMQLATFVKRIAIYDKSFCEVFTIMFLVRGAQGTPVSNVYTW